MKRISLRLIASWIVGATAVAASQASAQTPREIAEKAMPSVVALLMEDADGRVVAQASGFVVGAGLVATNWHVVEGEARGYAKLLDNDDRFQITGIVASDAARDLALLAVNDLDAPALPIADSNRVAVGDTVYVLGSPRGLEGTFSAGLISSIRTLKNGPIFQMTAPISEGSSGGPILNAKGEVIAVSFATIEAGQNLNFAVPSVFLSALIAQRGAVRPLNAAEPELDFGDSFWADVFESTRDQAAEGDGDAMFGLGVMYADGLGVAKDERKAMNWYRKAAEAGHASAMFILGLRYEDGRGVAKDEREAVKWYRKAAETGNTRAMVMLGAMYAEGLGVAKDERKAMNWYRKAAEAGHASAMFILGLRYEDGRGVAKDDREAVKWYRKAAEAGDAGAMLNLGVMYADGRGVAKDDREAVNWYRRAAQAGQASAMFNLALRYGDGRGVPKDDIEAYAWSSIAASLGDEEAREVRDVIARRLTREAELIAQQRARVLYDQIVDRGN